MPALTIAIVILGFLAGQIITFRMFFGRKRSRGVLAASKVSIVGFLVSIGVVFGYLAIGHIIWLFRH